MPSLNTPGGPRDWQSVVTRMAERWTAACREAANCTKPEGWTAQEVIERIESQGASSLHGMAQELGISVDELKAYLESSPWAVVDDKIVTRDQVTKDEKERLRSPDSTGHTTGDSFEADSVWGALDDLLGVVDEFEDSKTPPDRKRAPRPRQQEPEKQRERMRF